MTAIEEIVFKNIMIANTTDSTLSRLWIVGFAKNEIVRENGICFVLEDGLRDDKVKHKTCIPEGKYRLKPTRSSKFYAPYRDDPKLKAKYVLTLEDVPNFDLIRIHAGIDIEDTSGCQLPGLGSGMDTNNNFTLARSREALKRIYNYTDPYFDEANMDFTIPIYYECIRTQLINYLKKS
jgi:hypothetical protein